MASSDRPEPGRWRWIDSGALDGAAQMAADRAVLEHAAGIGIPTMRVYGWDPWCISLGYHQDASCLDPERMRRDSVSAVRRPTGGRAVFHAEEVTYSVVIPPGSGLSGVHELYNRISRGLAAGIRRLGVEAELEKRSLDPGAGEKNALSMSCFSAAARHEILVGGRKLVGSAQRRLAAGVLQHGSILTGDAHLALPEYLRGVSGEEREAMKKAMAEKTASVGGVLGRPVAYGEAVPLIRAGMEEELGIAFEETDLEETEKRFIHKWINEYRIAGYP